ncbi:PRC-barrel domain-containing protein [Bradyrhizobium japonicum]|uniref:PRC-barrel domain-containing protein n=1 Tax=Bradyrhizobium TaxID=374 RepID=UPI001BA52A63|nr:PRC-barrel domain-containing protein [Bradyrhizobium japonicum]MBR0803462.1 PRC-barrel domain-containing protein [Bradyrhizobium japonicum]UQD76136.1 PRC-barrel domain-containing protein [Bradyrhizobium japonicum]
MAMEHHETFGLIGSDKVEGTNVYGVDGEKVDYIECVIIDKVSGKVSYAVLSFGGLLGIGDDHYPLPWQALKYDTTLAGYVSGITQDQLRSAPKYADESSWNWSDPATTRSVNAHYSVPVA